MSYITFGPNDVVYIKDIGYATLVNCGSRSSLSQKIQSVHQKKESLIFDPDLFNSDGDSNHSRKSQDEKQDKKLVEVVSQKNFEEEKQVQKVVEKVEVVEVVEVDKPESCSQPESAETVNIVQARIQSTKATIFTSQKNVTKSITVIVKSLLINHKESIAIDIEINRNLDTLRKMIFQQLGETMNNYYNVRLYSMLPVMSELNVHSKTMIQCQIKDMAKIMLTGEYAFGFRSISGNLKLKYKTTLANNVTLTSSKIVEEAKKIDEKVVLALPPPEETSQSKTVAIKKVEAVQQSPAVVQKKQQTPQKQELFKKVDSKESELSSNKLEDGPYINKCPIQFSSGRRYWEIKIEKVPTEEEDLMIGVCVDSDCKEAELSCWGCDYAWAYQAIAGKKVSFQRDWESNVFEEESQAYGYTIRNNDTIGILVVFRGKKAYLSFYRNSISCGQAFVIEMDGLKSEQKQLIPFVGLGGEAQLTLDSKAQQPLDSFRWK